MLEPVYFDARYIRVEHHDGISRFSAGLLEALNRRTKVIAIICDSRQLEKLPVGIDYVQLNEPTSTLAEILIAKRLNHIGAKIVFSPMQTMGSWFRKYKLILTLHDLIYYAHPTPPPSFSWPIRIGWRLFHLSYLPQKVMLNRADTVATVSQTTKSLIEKHKLTKRPVVVVYNAGTETQNSKHSKPNNSLVYMGSFMDYKNVECLVDAMKLLPDFKLELLSRISPDRKRQLIERAGNAAERVIFRNGVTDAEYQRILDESFALVSASRDEGFGIPVIEAMGRGTPAVISDIEIFHEIGGVAARFFNPNRPEELASQIMDLAKDWNSASKAGIEQSKKFNWDASADALLVALQGL
ncbi:MAG: glycosyltransferase family 4 protein [Micrococcales bacterium]